MYYGAQILELIFNVIESINSRYWSFSINSFSFKILCWLHNIWIEPMVSV